jgi:hypothetical protein
MWSLCTRGLIVSDRLSDHLAALTEICGEKIAVLKCHGLIDQARLSVIAQLTGADPEIEHWADEIDSSTLAEVSKLGASLAITVMLPPQTIMSQE